MPGRSIENRDTITATQLIVFVNNVKEDLTPAQWAAATLLGRMTIKGKVKKLEIVWPDDDVVEHVHSLKHGEIPGLESLEQS